MTTTDNQVHTRGHPCRGIPHTSQIVCNYSDRIKAVREMNTIANLVKQTSTGVFLENNNSGLADKFGIPILIGAAKNGATPLVNENGRIGYKIDATIVNPDPPELMDTTKLGAVVARNSFAHVAGPSVKDSKGHINYNLLLRGYNKNGLQIGRQKDNYLGLELMHDGTDGLMILSSGSTSETTDIGTAQEKTLINYEDGETVRIRVSGIDTALATRAVTFEKRLTDSVEGVSDATWGAWFRLQ